jgi:hypothetical protein
LLDALSAAVTHFWAKHDPAKPMPKSAPNKKVVSTWLVDEHKVPARTAEEMAKIIHPK